MNWPTGAEVLAELRRLHPDRYKDAEHIGYTPGDGPPVSAAKLAQIMHAALEDVRTGGGRDIDLSI